MDSIKERVGAYLARTGKTKAEIAASLGMSRTAFFTKMAGKSEFSLTEAHDLAAMLDCSMDELFVSPFAHSRS